jgi:sulfur-oxidizing protein SoxX
MHPASSVERHLGYARRLSKRAKPALILLAPAIFVLAIVGCAPEAINATNTHNGEQSLAQIKASFIDRSNAPLDRLNQDEVQRLCSEYAGKTLPPEVAGKIEQSQLAGIKTPASGKLIGNWQAGEALAQEGRGLQFSDKADGPQGGNCYACHQLTREEIAYGNHGPSLYNYGKLRGNSDAIAQYTYGKIYNSQAYAACSIMPRFGHQHILTPEQIADIVALLLDPQSPVNR